jgi:hypothetical protein
VGYRVIIVGYRIIHIVYIIANNIVVYNTVYNIV